jgi:hypothetical protein
MKKVLPTPPRGPPRRRPLNQRARPVDASVGRSALVGVIYLVLVLVVIAAVLLVIFGIAVALGLALSRG